MTARVKSADDEDAAAADVVALARAVGLAGISQASSTNARDASTELAVEDEASDVVALAKAYGVAGF